MTLKSHAKFEEKLTCGLENNMRNLASFHQNNWKCQNWYFHGIPLFKVENAWATNYMRYRGVKVMTLKNDEKSEEKLTCHFKTNIRNLMNFDPGTQKSQLMLSWAAFDQII